MIYGFTLDLKLITSVKGVFRFSKIKLNDQYIIAGGNTYDTNFKLIKKGNKDDTNDILIHRYYAKSNSGKDINIHLLKDFSILFDESI